MLKSGRWEVAMVAKEAVQVDLGEAYYPLLFVTC